MIVLDYIQILINMHITFCNHESTLSYRIQITISVVNSSIIPIIHITKPSKNK